MADKTLKELFDTAAKIEAYEIEHCPFAQIKICRYKNPVAVEVLDEHNELVELDDNYDDIQTDGPTIYGIKGDDKYELIHKGNKLRRRVEK